MRSKRRIGLSAHCVAIVLLLFLTSCAQSVIEHGDNKAAEPAAPYYDPLEPLNRGIFVFNQAIDEMILKPAARLYIAIVPDGARTAVTNIINNLKTPVILANDLLQGDLDRAQSTIARFTVNTIIGFGGMADVAADLGTPRHSEDFGQTAATYGIGEGPYLMLPFLGPSNFRDAIGRVVDRFFDPLDYALEGSESFARAGIEGLDQRSRFLDVSEALEKTSIDYYASIRSVFSQNRKYEIRNGVPEPIIDIYGPNSTQ
jgi:phospholipid-binding lipoprotein MlaA